MWNNDWQVAPCSICTCAGVNIATNVDLDHIFMVEANLDGRHCMKRNNLIFSSGVDHEHWHSSASPPSHRMGSLCTVPNGGI